MDLQGRLLIPPIDGFSFVNRAVGGPAMHALLVTKDNSLSRDEIIRTNISELLAFAVSNKELWTMDKRNPFLDAVARQGGVSRNTVTFLLRIIMNARRRFVNHHRKPGTHHVTSPVTRAADQLNNHESGLTKVAAISYDPKLASKRRRGPDEQPVKRPRLDKPHTINVKQPVEHTPGDLPEQVLEGRLEEVAVPKGFFDKGKNILKPLLDSLGPNGYASQAWERSNSNGPLDYAVARIGDFLDDIDSTNQDDEETNLDEPSGIQQRLCDILKKTLHVYTKNSKNPSVPAISMSDQVRETVLEVSGIMEDFPNAKQQGGDALDQFTKNAELRLDKVAKGWDSLEAKESVINMEEED